MPRATGAGATQSSSPPSPEPSKPPLRICVFCSTTPGTGEAYLAAARSLAQSLYLMGAQLVYGGGTTGLMGEVAKKLVSLSGPQSVHGIIPRGILELERQEGAVDEAHTEYNGARAGKRTWKEKLGLAPAVTEREPAKNTPSESALPSENVYGRTTVVTDLQDRKKLMCQLINEGGPGSGFIALSGGFGTMDELMEMVTLRQYGVHKTRICLLNVDGFWDPLLMWMEAAIEKGFVRAEARSVLVEKETADECVAWLRAG